MNQLNLFQEVDGQRYWDLAERTGSALQEFYNTRENSAYTEFAQSCQKFAEETGISFIHASNKIHIMFNIDVMGKR